MRITAIRKQIFNKQKSKPKNDRRKRTDRKKQKQNRSEWSEKSSEKMDCTKCKTKKEKAPKKFAPFWSKKGKRFAENRQKTSRKIAT